MRLFLESLRSVAPAGTVILVDMLINDYFRNEEAVVDTEGNRISTRVLPDESKFDVIKNFPAVQELRDYVAPLGNDFQYTQFPDLNRWICVYRIK